MNLFNWIVPINKQADDNARKELGLIVGMWYRKLIVPYNVVEQINVTIIYILLFLAKNLLCLYFTRRAASLEN